MSFSFRSDYLRASSVPALPKLPASRIWLGLIPLGCELSSTNSSKKDAVGEREQQAKLVWRPALERIAAGAAERSDCDPSYLGCAGDHVRPRTPCCPMRDAGSLPISISCLDTSVRSSPGRPLSFSLSLSLTAESSFLLPEPPPSLCLGLYLWNSGRFCALGFTQGERPTTRRRNRVPHSLTPLDPVSDGYSRIRYTDQIPLCSIVHINDP